MHEVGLASSVIDAVRARAGDERLVLEVAVRVGASHRIAEDALRQGFAHQVAGTNLDGADLTIEHAPIVVSCRACGSSTETLDPLPVCATCGEVATTTTAGDELTLAWIRYAEPADATASAGG